jgi:hypothetical protein
MTPPFHPRIPTGFKSISPGSAVRAGQAIRAGWATRAYLGKPFPKFINSEGACARLPFHHATAQSARGLAHSKTLRAIRTSS